MTNAEHELMITLAMDAFRLCIGVKPQNHSLKVVIRWMRMLDHEHQLKKEWA